jgi:hypothetical protein
MSFVSTKLMGGLGNYLFQISTAYYLCLRDNNINHIQTTHQIFLETLSSLMVLLILLH